MKYPTQPYISVPLSFSPRVHKLDSLGQINSIVIKKLQFLPLWSLQSSIEHKC